jgi:hypothetical protein
VHAHADCLVCNLENGRSSSAALHGAKAEEHAAEGVASTDVHARLFELKQLAGVHACVALRRVEVLVAEQFLDLAHVRAGVEKLGGEGMALRLTGLLRKKPW